jgi:phosphatidylethanolamine-binding protein (PEBP) family uncharacterized protein
MKDSGFGRLTETIPPSRIRRLSRTTAVGVIAVGTFAAGLTLAGCGGSSTPSTTAANARGIRLASPALVSGNTIPTRYTCDGKDISLPLRWSGVPAGTAKLALFILDFQQTRIANGSVSGKVSVQWAVANLSPTLSETAAGKLPPGAIIGRNRLGHKRYSICPARGALGNFIFLLYALPHTVAVHRGFNGNDLLNRLNHSSTTHGLFVASYSRA